MRKALGHLIGSGPDGIQECDTHTCNHCNRVFEIKPYESPSICRVCMSPICNSTFCHSGCRPYEREVERIERAARTEQARQEALRSYGL